MASRDQPEVLIIAAWPKGWRFLLSWLQVFAAGAALPVAFLYYAPLIVFNQVYVLFLWLRRGGTGAQGGGLSSEGTAAFVSIPVASVVATVGTSWAFYLWSNKGSDVAPVQVCGDSPLCDTYNSSGWSVLSLTLILTSVIIYAAVSVIRKHASGDIADAYMADVKPDAAMRMLQEDMLRAHADALPGLRIDAQREAYVIVASNPAPLSYWTPFLSIWQRHRLRLAVFVVLGAIGIVVHDSWLEIGVIGVIVLSVFSGSLFLYSASLDYRVHRRRACRQLRRHRELQSLTVDGRNDVEDAGPRVSDMRHELTALRRRVTMLSFLHLLLALSGRVLAARSSRRSPRESP